MKRKVTEELCEQAVVMYQEGMSFTDIAEKIGVNRATISRALREKGIVTARSIDKVLPDVHSIAYLAGLFDGEGSINIFKQKRENMSQPAYFLEISIGNTHKGVLQWVLENFGGRLTHNGVQYTPNSHKTWRWRASSDDAYKILMVILPFLIVKKSQAQLAMEFRERQLAFNAGAHNPMTEEEVDWRESQRIKLSTMRFWEEDE